MLTMTRSVYKQIQETIGRLPAEQGGILGGDREVGAITHFCFDGSARRSGVAYSPDHECLNRLLSEDWNPKGISLLGFVHSHPPGVRGLSAGDLAYARVILTHNPQMKQIVLPVVLTMPGVGKFEMHFYSVAMARDQARAKPAKIVLVEDQDVQVSPAQSEIIAGAQGAEPTSGTGPEKEVIAREAAGQPPTIVENKRFDPVETFRRVRGAYDLDHLSRCRVIYVGVGGAAQFAEDMARAGVGEHVLIDGDTASESNIATQQVFRRDLGRYKVDCVADRIRDINPAASVIACRQPLDDGLEDSLFRKLACSPLQADSPSLTLICGLTDDFHAQARVNRLALQFALPSLCAQVYHEGRGAEVTFTYPGVTPACHRCALSSRYRAYLEEGFRNDVGSDGTPICATTRLNALKGFVAMALLHHGQSHPRWGRLLTRIGNRSLIQIRMDPDLPFPVFERVFGGGDSERILFDDAVWLPQEAECPENGYERCPDCGGTGDLRNARDTFVDTRLIRSSQNGGDTM